MFMGRSLSEVSCESSRVVNILFSTYFFPQLAPGLFEMNTRRLEIWLQYNFTVCVSATPPGAQEASRRRCFAQRATVVPGIPLTISV